MVVRATEMIASDLLGEQRITISEAARRVGMSPRRLGELAARGRVPGAAQMAGARGRWTFSPTRLSKWIHDQEAKASCQINQRSETSIKGGIPGGGGSKSDDRSTAEAFERLFGPKRKSALMRGGDR
jgi:hypothetical protein